jgi:Ca2+-binding EF-hand superfamily protein
VQYFCDKIWLGLINVKGHGTIDMAEIDHFFDEADLDKTGQINEEEMLTILKKRTNDCPGVARVVASQCLSMADKNKNGKVSKAELIEFLRDEMQEHSHANNKHAHDELREVQV